MDIITTAAPERARLRRSRWLLTLAVTALFLVAGFTELQRWQHRELQTRSAAFAAADRFVELAIRARLLLTADPAALAGQGGADSLTLQPGGLGWAQPLQLRWQMLPGQPNQLLLQIDGVPKAPCAWFAVRLLQRGDETGTHGLRVNDLIYVPQAGVREIDVDALDRLACRARNVVALIVVLPDAATMPAAPFERRV